METIQLAVTSPRVTLTGVDAAIERMTELDALQTRMREHSETPIRIKFMMEGAEGLQQAASKVQSFSAGINEMADSLRAFEGGGLSSLGDKLAKGMVSSGEAVKIVSMQLKALRAETAAHDQATIGKQASWQAMDADPSRWSNPAGLDNLAAKRKAMVDAIAQGERMHQQLTELARLEGGLTAVQGQYASETKETAGAEKELAGAAKQSGEALKVQDEIVRKKMISLGLLEEKVTKLTAAEEELLGASNEAAEAGKRYEGTGVISTRTRKTEDGEVVSQNVQGSTGEVKKYVKGEQIGTDTSEVEKFEAQLTAIRTQSLEDQSKTLAGTAERIELLRTEAGQIREQIGLMKVAGLEQHELAREAGLRATALENSASTQEIRGGKVEDWRDEQARQASLMQSAKDYRAEIERTAYTEKKSGVDAMKVLDDRTHRLGVLRAEMQAAGLGNTPQGATMMRGLESAQHKAMADSLAIEQEMGATLKRNTEIVQRFNAEAAKYPKIPKRTETVETAGGSTQVTSYEREINGRRELIRLRQEFNKLRELEDARSNAVESASPKGRNSRGLINLGENFTHNLATVVQWTAATTALYGSFELLKKGAEAIVEVETQTAHLQAVFHGTREETVALRDSMLSLAEANGRSGDEAMDAAIHWARLGLTANETAQAVDVSLKAANLSDMTSGEAVSQLTALYSTYHLQVGDLAGMLGELNSVSNNYNATQKDMFDGLARTSGMAKEAGLSLSELIGLIGSGVGRTGRSGTEIGNAIKKLTVAENNPPMQQELHTQFKIDVITPGGDIKNESVLLRELYERYQQLDEVERRQLITRLGGARAGGQIQAVLDGYVNAQVLAIRAQLNLNSAEREAGLIRQTTLSELKSVGTEFERLAVAMGDLGVNDVFKRLAGEIGDFADELTALSKGDWKKVWAMEAGEPGAFRNDGLAPVNPDEKAWIDATSRKQAMDKTVTTAGTLSNTTESMVNRNPLDLERQLDKFSGVAWYDDPVKGDEMRETLKAMVEAKDVAGIQAVLAERIEYARKQSAISAGIEAAESGKTIASERASLDTLDLKIEALHKAGKNDDDADVAALRKQKDDLQTKYDAHIGQSNLDTTPTSVDEDGESYFTEAGEAGERIKARMEGMASLKEKITEGSGRDVALNEQNVALVQAQLAALAEKLSNEDENNIALKQGIEKRQNELNLQLAGLEVEKQFAALRDEAFRANERVGKQMEGIDAISKGMPTVTGTKEEELDRSAVLRADELAMIQQQLDANAGVNQLLEGQLRTRQRTLQLQQEGIELEREFARIQDAEFQGKKQGDRDSEQYRYGRNETEKLLNEARGLLGSNVGSSYGRIGLAGELDRANDRVSFDNDPAAQRNAFNDRQVARTPRDGSSVDMETFAPVGQEQKAHDEAEALEIGNRLYSIRESMLDRQAKLSADIVDAKRKENEEASKGLELASREDQLKAALLERYAQQNGRMSADQFQFLDKNTREVADKLAPDSAPEDRRSPVRELEREKALLDRSIGQMSDRITAALAGLRPGASAATPPPPQFTAPPMTFTFGDEMRQFGETMAGVVKAGLQKEITGMRHTLVTLAGNAGLTMSQAQVSGGVL